MCEHLNRFENFYGEKSFTGTCNFDNKPCDMIGACRHKFYCPVCKEWFYSKNNIFESKARCNKCGSVVELSTWNRREK